MVTNFRILNVLFIFCVLLLCQCEKQTSQNLHCTLAQGVKLTFFSGSHLAPKYFKVVANSKKLVVIMTHTQTILTLSLCQVD